MIWPGGVITQPSLKVEGPGIVAPKGLTSFGGGIGITGVQPTIAPGKTYRIPIKSLNPDENPFAVFWNEPGEYMLPASYTVHTGLPRFPAPGDKKAVGKPQEYKVSTPPVKVQVVLEGGPLDPGDSTRTLTVGDLKRSYLVHIPKSYDPKKPTPVVLAFHGGGGNADSMVAFCGLNTKADAAGFIVVYPNGTGRLEKVLTFNGGNCCGYAMTNKIDDVEFTRKVFDDLATSAHIDPKRVFATGMSNGGIMSNLLAS